MNHWATAALVGLGGSIGALARYGASRLAAMRETKPHYATLAVNWGGTLAIGVLSGLEWRTGRPALYAFLGTGILGGLTTYSTLNVQKATMAGERRYRTLSAYAALTYGGGWLLYALGWLLGRNL